MPKVVAAWMTWGPIMILSHRLVIWQLYNLLFFNAKTTMVNARGLIHDQLDFAKVIGLTSLIDRENGNLLEE
jgi:hypothetical protein